MTVKMWQMLALVAERGPVEYRNAQGRIQLDGRIMAALLRRCWIAWASDRVDETAVMATGRGRQILDGRPHVGAS